MKRSLSILLLILSLSVIRASVLMAVDCYPFRAQKDSVNAELFRARSLAMQGNTSDASEICKRIMKSNPGNKDAVRLWLMINMKRTPTAEEDAIKMLNALEKSYPENSAILFWKSFLQAEHGHNEEALAGFETLTKIQPDTAVNWIAKGQVLQELERYEEAGDAFDKAASLAPERLDIQGMKGIALARQGKYDEAIDAFNKALRVNPDSPVDLYNRACVFSLKGDRSGALEDLGRAISLNPGFKQSARSDEDFKNLWDDDDFRNLTR
jgi:tetratricopeptide (TPR) repeat protein